MKNNFKKKNKWMRTAISLALCIFILTTLTGCGGLNPLKNISQDNAGKVTEEKTDIAEKETDDLDVNNEETAKDEDEGTAINTGKINKFSDLNGDFLEEFDIYAKSVYDELVVDTDYMKTEAINKFNYYDRNMGKYELILVTQLMSSQNMYDGTIHYGYNYSIVKATNFKVVDGKIKADFTKPLNTFSEEALVNGLKFNGFGLAGEEKFENKKIKIQEAAKNVDGVVDVRKQKGYRMTDYAYCAEPNTLIKEEPSMDAKDVVKGQTLVDNLGMTSLDVIYEKKTADGKTWFFVETFGDEIYTFCGWVLKDQLSTYDLD